MLSSYAREFQLHLDPQDNPAGLTEHTGVQQWLADSPNWASNTAAVGAAVVLGIGTHFTGGLALELAGALPLGTYGTAAVVAAYGAAEYGTIEYFANTTLYGQSPTLGGWGRHVAPYAATGFVMGPAFALGGRLLVATGDWAAVSVIVGSQQRVLLGRTPYSNRLLRPAYKWVSMRGRMVLFRGEAVPGLGDVRTNALDVALLFSQDQDFTEVADEVRAVAREQGRWIKIASAFPRSRTASNPRGVNKTDWIPIDRSLYDACIDPRDYRPGRRSSGS